MFAPESRKLTSLNVLLFPSLLEPSTALNHYLNSGRTVPLHRIESLCIDEERQKQRRLSKGTLLQPFLS